MASAYHPPPTINSLDRHERMRLVRTNRKLEAVLGAAPYYLESRSPERSPYAHTAKASRREGRIFGHSSTPSSASSSTTSLDSLENYIPVEDMVPVSKKGPRNLELSRPLLLRLRSVPVPSSENRTPRLPSMGPISPISSTFTIDLESMQATSMESRRKKIAKLTRTLGENIPPELVFPSPKSSDAVDMPLKERSVKRARIPSPFTAPSPSSHNDIQPPIIISRPKAQKPRSRPRLPPAASATASAPTPHAPRESSKGSSTITERRRKPRPRSLSLSTGTDMLIAAAHARSQGEAPKRVEDVLVGSIAVPLVQSASIDVYANPQYITVDEKATKDIFQSRSPLPFQTTIHVAPTHRHARSSPTNAHGPHVPQASQHSKSASTSASSQPSARGPSVFQFGRRKGLGWSGEWNQDMEKVVKNLRNLKAR